MRNDLVAFFLLILCFGCESSDKLPQFVVSKDEMIEIITDVQIAESYIKLKFAVRNDSVQLTDSIYNAIYRKHNLTKEAYDSSFSYYVNRPEILQEIYEAAIINLSTLDAKNEGEKQKKQVRDTLPVNPAI
ncbi:DUF4296 domain-containing protein [Acidiluteibacter ferrifornacis]|uniref:DUF4296 domain-containing protein n=1 Tax=Acidiluteibacter ferrifornacis TaxID=2692424 RepID=A0A6N9NH39_9FLAO|nr:DUF4296 domain-containing protein [Acidiluteibacter ferrifornacis]NBG65149.1 DUF4296 domain-containing protein [Acidiluteibacter ferrifornacis]